MTNSPIAKASGIIGAIRNWAAYNRAQIIEKKSFLKLLSELCKHVPDLARKPGAGRLRIPMPVMVFAVVLKTYVCLGSRRFTTDATEAKEKGYISRIPHFNSVSRYMALPEMYTVLKELINISARPLKEHEDEFSVDSSGFSTGQFSQWMTEKYGKKTSIVRRGTWVKCHLTCGNLTHIVTAVNITNRRVGDSTQFRSLIEQTSQQFTIKRVMADKAYLDQENFRLVDEKGGVAFIPFKPNSRLGGNNRNDVWKAMYYFFHLHHDRFRKIYGQRSHVETVFSSIKRKYGERLRGKTETAQMNEVLCKVLCHNICCVIHARLRMRIRSDFGNKSHSS